jgi:hypothetical protein
MKLHWKTLAAALVFTMVPLSLAEETKTNRPDRAELEKRRAELKKLTPEEREAKLKEWRKTNAVPGKALIEKRREQFKKLTPEERVAKREELKARVEQRIAELREKEAKGPLTALEKRELQRREQILTQFEKAEAAGLVVRSNREPAAPPPPKN